MADQDNRVELTLVVADKASPVVVDANKKITESARATAQAALEASQSQIAAEGSVEEAARLTSTAVAGEAEAYGAVSVAARASAAERESAEIGVQEALAQTARAEADLAEGGGRIGASVADGSAAAEAGLSGVATEAAAVGEALARLGASAGEELSSAGAAGARLGEEVGASAEKISEAGNTAAAALAKVTEAASAAGPAATSAGEEVVSASERIAKAAADEAEALGLSGTAARAALEQVESASARIERAISGGGRGLSRSLQVATVAATELEAEITRLGGEGKDVSALEARLASLRAEIQAGATKAGQLAATHREVTEAVHAAQRAAGEYEGTLGNLREVVATVSPGLGKVVGNVLALHAGSFILIAVAKQLVEVLQEVGKKGAKELENHLDELDRKMRIQSGEAGQYATNLREILRKQGYDVAGDGITQLIAKMDDYEERLRKSRIEVQKLADGVAGNAVDLGVTTKRVLGEIVEVEKRATEATALDARRVFATLSEEISKLGASAPPVLIKVNTALAEVVAKGGDYRKVALEAVYDLKLEIQQYELLGKTAPASLTLALSALKALAIEGRISSEVARNLLADVQKQIDAYERLGKEAPAALLKARDALQSLARTSADVLAEHEKLITAMGVQTPDALAKSIRALLDFQREIERSGSVTTEQAQLMLRKIEELRKAIALLPEDQRKGLEGYLKELDQLEAKLRETGDVARETFGIKTPEEIQKSVESLKGLITALGPIGSLTKEQAEKVSGAARQILDQFALVTPAEREANAEVIAWAKSVEGGYARASLGAKSFATNTVEALKKADEQLKALKRDVESVGDSLLAAVRKAQGDKKSAADQNIGDLKKKVSDLEDKTLLTVDEENQLADLKQKLNDAESAAHGLGGGNKEVSASADEVNASIGRIIQSLGQNKDAWNSLDESQRQAIQNYLEGLQQSAETGNATQSQIQNVMKAVTEQLNLSGVSVSGLTDGFNQAAGAGLNISKAFEGIGRTLPNVTKAGDDMTSALSPAKLDGTSKAVDKLGTDFKGLGTQIDDTRTKLSAFNDMASQVITTCQHLTDCLHQQAAV